MVPAALLLVPSLLSSAAVAETDLFDEGRLGAAVWEGAPEVLAARGELIEAGAARDRAHLLPNPVLGATWGTIPIGTRAGGAAFSDVPSYTVGVSELFELGKRGPRQEAAEAGRRAAHFAVLDAYRRSFFAVLESLSNQAAATIRIAVLERLVASSEESLRLQRARADRGDVAALEVDRLRVEHLRLQSSLRGAEAEREASLLTCMGILARDCPRFASEEEADRFLHRLDVSEPARARAMVADRPDLQALGAESLRLRAERLLAARLKIPDLTAIAAYTRDQFVIAGNQPNSLTLGLSLPLPLFDRGQIEVVRTDARLSHNERMLETLSARALRSLEIGRRQLAALQDRARILEDQALPQARDVLDRTVAAAHRGGAALPDILLVRRALEELALDRVEVAAAAHRASLELRRTAGDLPLPRSPAW